MAAEWSRSLEQELELEQEQEKEQEQEQKKDSSQGEQRLTELGMEMKQSRALTSSTLKIEVLTLK